MYVCRYEVYGKILLTDIRGRGLGVESSFCAKVLEQTSKVEELEEEEEEGESVQVL